MHFVKHIFPVITLISTLLCVWIFCTGPSEPEYEAFFEDKQIRVQGTSILDSLLILFIKATGTEPLYYEWLKDNMAVPDEHDDTLIFNPLQTAHSGNYRCVVWNELGADTSLPYALVVYMPPKIVANPQSKSIYVGDSATFTFSATGTAPLGYQWQKNGINISGATDTGYTTPPATFADSNSQYRCLVSNAYGSVTSNIAILTVNTPEMPVIMINPQSQSVLAGSTASFAVSVTGTSPVHFQWQKNGTDMAAATDSVYTTPAATMADSGSQFRCIASNSAGSDTSEIAVLSVTANIVEPQIITHPLDASILAGDSATFTVSATGTSPLSYQWQKNGADITGAAGSDYTTPAVTKADSGSQFRCIVSNAGGVDTSEVAVLSVTDTIVRPEIIIHPQNKSVFVGESAIFDIVASGTAPLSYRWQKNSADIPGETGTEYTILAAASQDSGSLFRCIVSNAAGADTSEEALLKVYQDIIAPVITTQPLLQSVTEGQTATFSIVATGTAPLSYQWQKNKADISGATDSVYTSAAATMSDSGSMFRCIVQNAAGSDTSDEAMLKVNFLPIAPTITTQPQPQSVTEGQTAVFRIMATGTEPIHYQWQRDIVDIAGATLNTYTTPPCSLADDSALFRCIAGNSAGADTSDTARLTVEKIVTWEKVDCGFLLEAQKKIVVGDARSNDGVQRVYSGDNSGVEGNIYEFSFNDSVWNKIPIKGSNDVSRVHGLKIGDVRNNGTNQIMAIGYNLFEYNYANVTWESGAVGPYIQWTWCFSIGKGRNDNKNYVYIDDNTEGFYEVSYNFGDWSAQKIETAPFDVHSSIVTDGRNDGVQRLYIVKESNIYELSWNSSSWDIAECATISGLTVMTSIEMCSGFGRNDNVNRLYLHGNNNGIYELSYNGGQWETTTISETVKANGITLAQARNDGLDRLYAATKTGIGEYSFSGSWQKTLNMETTFEVNGIAVGNGRNDGINRIYVTGNDKHVYEFAIKQLR